MCFGHLMAVMMKDFVGLFLEKSMLYGMSLIYYCYMMQEIYLICQCIKSCVSRENKRVG